jgi:hypothetical protein
MKYPLSTLLCSLAVIIGGPAFADIQNFQFVGISGRGSLDGQLSSRLGTTVNSTEHAINVEDCEKYTGGEALVTVRINPLPVGEWQYAVAWAPPGKTCSTNNANPEGTADTCIVAAAQRELTSSTIEFVMDFDSLMGSACDANVEGTAKIYIIIEEPSLVSVASQVIDVLVDLRPPSTPTLDTVTGGDQRFEARWTDDDNVAADTTYSVYWDDVLFGDDDLDDVSSRNDLTTTSASIDASTLENGVTYYVGVVAVDDADNRSPLSNVLEVVPEETVDFWEGYSAAGGTDPGGFCFIATVAWGSPSDAHLDTLRAFRDDVLMGSAWGRGFVEDYYLYGRFAAAWIADKPVLKALVRAVLAPVSWFAWLVVVHGPAAGFGAVLSLVAMFIVLRRAVRRRFAVSHLEEPV